jgi:DNA-binding CsgD family transcriptional regulator
VIASKKTSSSNSKFFAGTAREILIPLSILKNNSSLEAIVCYLKDIQNLNYSQIASILNRDPRTIWVTYSNSKKKKISLHLDDNLAEYSDSSHSDFLKSVHRNLNAFKILLPAKIFESRKFSVLESIVLYLKTNHALSFNQIAALLGKNYRTIWTVYKRALMKLEQKSLSKSRITNE